MVVVKYLLSFLVLSPFVFGAICHRVTGLMVMVMMMVMVVCRF